MMHSLPDRLVRFIDERSVDLLAAPQMWGSREAVELQILLLMELRGLVLRPSLEAENPRWLLDHYSRFLANRFPSARPSPLFEHLPEASTAEETFTQILHTFQSELAASVVEENLFEHADVALFFRFAPGRNPSITACTSYYDDFRRALRSVAATPDTAGRRPKKDIEHATDFGWEDARISPANGRHGSVALKLVNPLADVDVVAQERVRASLSQIVTLAEWAHSNEDVRSLAIDDEQLRTHTALQTCRLLPRRGILSVDIGGRMVGRAKPVQLHAALAERFMSVVAADDKPEPFERMDEIRAIDLDRGTIRLGAKPGVTVYSNPEELAKITQVGVVATVCGVQYSPRLGKQPFVFASSVTLKDQTPDDA